MATFMGAMVGFLRFNFAREKIFMGDAGSLLVGNLLIGSGIYLLNFTQSKVAVNSGFMYALIGFFALPVLDALRVFLGRMKKGLSPFSADKSHIHHLFLLMGLTHRQIAFLIAAINLSILVATLLMNGALSLTVSVLIIVVVFSMLGFVLNLNKKVKEWTVRLRQLED